MPSSVHTPDRAEKATERRRRRHDRRQRLRGIYGHQARLAGSWDGIPGRRTAACGVALVPGFDGVEIRAKANDDGNTYAYAVGTQTCGSVWGCPTCEAKIRQGRATEIEEAAKTHTGRGGTLLMVTLTVRHHADDPLADLIDGLRKAWRSIQQGKGWRPYRRQLVGTITALEVTYGRNGFHPHLHVLLFLEHGPNAELLRDELAAWLAPEWCSEVAAELSVSPSLDHGVHVQVLDHDAAGYVSKIADETARGDLKSGARNPMGLVDFLDPDVLADVEHRDHERSHDAWRRWSEYVAATKGRSSVRWSRGLRAALAAGEPVESCEHQDEGKCDECLAAGAEQGGELVETVEHRTWLRISNRRNAVGVLESVALLESVERIYVPTRESAPPHGGAPPLVLVA